MKTLLLRKMPSTPGAYVATFKVALLGDGGCGTTSFVKMLQSGKFEERYIPTIGVEVTPVVFNTTAGTLRFNVWDTAGMEKFGGLRDGYYICSDAAIIFFELTPVSNRLTYKNVARWHMDFSRVCNDCPVVIVGNKSDIRDRTLDPSQMTFANKGDVPHVEMSVKTGRNIGKPFLLLARALLHDETLEFLP